MQKVWRNGSLVGRARSRIRLAKRARRQREIAIEPLEGRTLLAYAFYYAPISQQAFAVGDSATTNLTIQPAGGVIEYSVNGGPFQDQWINTEGPGTLTVPTETSVTVQIQLPLGDGSNVTIGTPSGPASQILAQVRTIALPSTNMDSVLIDDSNGTEQASGPNAYTIDTQPGQITGPGIYYNQYYSQAFGGGVTLLGSSVDGNVYNVKSVFDAFEPLTIVAGDAGSSTVNVGNGTLEVGSPLAVYSTGSSVTLNINDQDDTTSTAVSLDNHSGNPLAPYEVTGIGPAPIEYGSGVTELNLYGGTAGINYSVSETQLGTTANLFNDGDDTVYISDSGSVEGILGSVYVENDGIGTFTDMIVDASADDLSHMMTLTGGDPTSTLTGLAPATISYETLGLNSLTISTSDFGEQTLAVDFASFNPIPIPQLGDVPGLSFNGGADSTSNPFSHQLILYGINASNPFTSETNNAQDPDILDQEYGDSFAPFYGDIQFTDSLANNYYLEYTGLQPITDIVPAATYTFNDFGYPDQSFNAYSAGGYTTPDASQTVANGIVFLSSPLAPATTPTFESTYISDKGVVTFNAPAQIPGFPGSGLNGIVNIPTASDELTYLQFNAPTGGTNNVQFIAVPDILYATGYTGGPGDDVTSVIGTGMPLLTGGSGDYTNYLDGAGGNNTLNYDAGGLTPTITPDGSGGVLISIPGYGTVEADNYQTINITNAGPGTITPGSPYTINTIEGFQNVNVTTATFTVAFPDGITSPPASNFTASIDWGDPSPDPDAGTIIQDASNPSIYYIKGSHTFSENGTYTVANTVVFAGGTYTLNSLVPGVSINVTFGPSSPVTLAPAKAVVTQGSLAVSAFPIVGTAGLAIPSQPVATFIDAGGAGPIGDYSAQVDIINPNGLITFIPGTVTISQNGNAEQYTVTSPPIPGSAIPEAGTYLLEVIVTDSGGATPIIVDGTALAVIKDAPLTAGTLIPLSPNTGVPIPATTVIGTFTDANIYAPATDFTAVISWGDGSPTTIGTIVETGPDSGVFDIEGGHTYAKPGLYPITINVKSVGGSIVTVTGTATVTDLPVTLLTTTATTATEGLSTGQFVLYTFTDPNTLATVADVSATLAAGGWGDGTPAAAGTNLQVVEIGVTPITGEPIFEVLGSHIYSTFTPVGSPNDLTVIVTTLGGAATTLTGSTVTVLDARLTSSNGTEITGVEGISTGTILLGTFTSEDPTAPLGDFSATINWGGAGVGSTVATITQPGGVGTPFDVFGSYTYNEEGTYAYTVTVNDIGGQSTTISGSAIIADAPLTAVPTAPIATSESPVYPTPEFGAPIFTGIVGAFTDANPKAPISDFEVTIDWGDGSPNSVGTVTQPGGVGTVFDVTGSHTYASSTPPGVSYPITIYVSDVGGSKVTLTNKANVAPIPLTVTGILNPSSDSGKSQFDDITNVTQPNFYGKTLPYANVTLYATPVGSSTSLTIGHVEAGSDGSWSITSDFLANGKYTITASAVDQFGQNATPPFAITPVLTVDTEPPVITNLTFNRFDATLTVTFQAGLSGMDLASITNSAFYHISATPLAKNVHVPKLILPTQIYYTPGALPTDPVVVNVVFNNGKVFRGGKYMVVIDSGTGDTGIQSVAGTPLDGNYYGTFPAGDGLAGGDFVADIYTFHRTILPFVPIKDGYSPPPAGIDPPAGTKLPKTTGKHKAVVVSTASHKVAAQSARLKAVDKAIGELAGEPKKKK